MPISFDLESLPGIGIGIGRGRLSHDEVKLGAMALWDLMPGPSYFILWDLREARFSMTTSEVRELAEYITSNAPAGESRTAFVVSGDLEFGLVRMFEVFRESEDSQTFVSRDRQLAVDWLTGIGSRE